MIVFVPVLIALYAIISSPLPSSSIPSTLIKPGLVLLIALPPTVVWNKSAPLLVTTRDEPSAANCADAI